MAPLSLRTRGASHQDPCGRPNSSAQGRGGSRRETHPQRVRMGVIVLWACGWVCGGWMGTTDAPLYFASAASRSGSANLCHVSTAHATRAATSVPPSHTHAHTRMRSRHAPCVSDGDVLVRVARVAPPLRARLRCEALRRVGHQVVDAVAQESNGRVGPEVSGKLRAREEKRERERESGACAFVRSETGFGGQRVCVCVCGGWVRAAREVGARAAVKLYSGRSVGSVMCGSHLRATDRAARVRESDGRKVSGRAQARAARRGATRPQRTQHASARARTWATSRRRAASCSAPTSPETHARERERAHQPARPRKRSRNTPTARAWPLSLACRPRSRAPPRCRALVAPRARGNGTNAPKTSAHRAARARTARLVPLRP
jgi:hypothetical protein